MPEDGPEENGGGARRFGVVRTGPMGYAGRGAPR